MAHERPHHRCVTDSQLAALILSTTLYTLLHRSNGSDALELVLSRVQTGLWWLHRFYRCSKRRLVHTKCGNEPHLVFGSTAVVERIKQQVETDGRDVILEDRVKVLCKSSFRPDATTD